MNIVGHCEHCHRAMGSQRTYRAAGLAEHVGHGRCRSCARRTTPLKLRVAADEQEWRERALCAETYPEAFFPEKGGSTREAKQVCTGCEVRAECLEYALANNEAFGIWGGLSVRERRNLTATTRQRTARAAA